MRVFGPYTSTPVQKYLPPLFTHIHTHANIIGTIQGWVGRERAQQRNARESRQEQAEGPQQQCERQCVHGRHPRD